jgi:hypothetical protein
MDRRVFLRLSGLLAASAAALNAFPAAAQGIQSGLSAPTVITPEPPVPMQPPGLYQITGRVSLQEPHVAITGITNAQQISWSGDSVMRSPSAGFSSFEYFTEPWHMPDVRVRGGRLEALAVTPVELA